MKRIAVIFVGATPRQNIYWWNSYKRCSPGYEHDLILVHRDMDGVPHLDYNNIIYENKLLPTGEVECKAFGAYRHYFNKYQDKYEFFAFISDDVYLRRDDWIKDVIDIFDFNSKIGFISPLLYNNPPHLRAPVWFGRTECLKKIDWSYSTDHEGEMTMADRCTAAGYFGVQIGHKCDFAYDPEWDGNANPRVCGAPQPTQYLERIKFGNEHFETGKFSPEEIKSLDRYYDNLKNDICFEELTDIIIRPNIESQRWNLCLEIQPYHGLIYNKSLSIAKQENLDIYIWDKTIQSGEFDPTNGILFGRSNGIYQCVGINKDNPIAILNFR